MADYGIKIVSPNKKITSINPRDYRVWSKYKDFKITRKGRDALTIPDASLTARATVTHNLGYAPAYFFWVDLEHDGKYWMVGSNLGTVGTTPHYTEEAQSTKESISFLGGRDTSVGAAFMPYGYTIFDQRVVDAYAGNDKPIGYRAADYGLKATLPGVNVMNAKLHEQVINSNCEALQYLHTTTIILNWDNTSSGNALLRVIHNLGYVPMFFAWGNFGPNATSPFDKDNMLPVGRSPNPFVSGAWADTTHIGVEIAWAGGGATTGKFIAKVVTFKNSMLT